MERIKVVKTFTNPRLQPRPTLLNFVKVRGIGRQIE
jgi:hypothetical protein